MAYERYGFDDEEDRRRAVLDDTLAPPTVTTSTAAASAAPMGGPSIAGGAQTPGTRFVNFERWLGANQGGAQAMMDRAQKAVTDRGEKAANAIHYAGQTHLYQPDPANNPMFNEPLPGSTQAQSGPLQHTNSPGTTGMSTRTGTQTYQAPQQTRTVDDPNTPWNESHVLTPEERAQYGAAATSQYAGPTGGLRDFAGLAKSALEAEDYARAGATHEGLRGILGKEYGQKATRLDAALAGYGAGGRFEELKAKYGKLGETLEGANAEAYGRSQEAMRKHDAKVSEAQRRLAEDKEAGDAKTAKEKQDAIDEEGRTSTRREALSTEYARWKAAQAGWMLNSRGGGLPESLRTFEAYLAAMNPDLKLEDGDLEYVAGPAPLKQFKTGVQT